MPSRVTLPPLTVQVSGDGKGKGGAMRSADKRAGRRNSPYDKKGKSPKKKKAVSPGPLSSGLSSAISKLGVASATRSRTKAVWPTPALPDSSVFGSGGARGVVQRLQEKEMQLDLLPGLPPLEVAQSLQKEVQHQHTIKCLASFC